MTVEAILTAVDTLSPAERAWLLARLRDRYSGDAVPLGEPDATAAGNPEQTGIYSLEQVVRQIKRKP